MASAEGAMDSIDVQFDRAVEIVQGLPKTGPVQTGYDEKLVMYSLYKQATVGNVKSPRPGIWDMLGRAKWDAWARHKDLDSLEAKRLYVEALLKVLRRYSDKTVAKSLVDELESYQGDTPNFLRNRDNGHISDSDSSGTSALAGSPRSQYTHETLLNRPDVNNENGLEEHDGPTDLPNTNAVLSVSHLGRPTSSMSSTRYRTPLAGSHVTSPPPSQNIPNLQPRPSFETPSAFADPRYSRSPHGSTLFQSSYTGQYEEPIHSGLITPPVTSYPSSQYRGNSQPLPRPRGGTQQAPRITLERAVEQLQTQVAALQERLGTLEASSRFLSKSLVLPTSRGSSPNNRRGVQWDINDLGLWSVVLNPLFNSIDVIRNLARFLARDENRSPVAVIIRRLCLDFSFLLCAVVITRFLWRGSSARRREVRSALKILWKALLGTKTRNVLVDEGV